MTTLCGLIATSECKAFPCVGCEPENDPDLEKLLADEAYGIDIDGFLNLMTKIEYAEDTRGLMLGL